MQEVVPEKDQMWSFSIMSAGRFDGDCHGTACLRELPSMM
jgi:hypothetical protein